MNIFRRVAVKSLLKNRTRTIVTIIGVILSGHDRHFHALHALCPRGGL